MGGHKTLYGCPNCYTPSATRAHIRVRIMEISVLTVDRIFRGTNQPNPQVMDSTPSAARQSLAPIRRARGKELWFPHFQNDGSRAELVAKWEE